MPKKSAYHHGDLRSALLAAARQLLEERGPSALSLSEVARRIGVSAPAVYHHFASREAIATALAKQGFEALDQEMKAVFSRDGQALSLYGEAYIGFARQNPGLYRLMFGEGFATTSPEGMAVQALRRPAYGALKAGLIKHMSPDEVPYAALFLWALTHGLALLMIDDQIEMRETDAAIVERVFRIAKAGMAATLNP